MPFPSHFQQLSPHAVLHKDPAILNHHLNFSFTASGHETLSITVSRAKGTQFPWESEPFKSSPFKMQPWLVGREMGTKPVPFFRRDKSSNLPTDYAGPTPATTSAKCLTHQKPGRVKPCSLLSTELHPYTNHLCIPVYSNTLWNKQYASNFLHPCKLLV